MRYASDIRKFNIEGDIKSCRLSDRPQELPSGNSQDSTPLRFGTAELCSGTAKPSAGGFQGIDKVWLMVGASRLLAGR